jgi:hypothetical protein
MNSSNNGGRVRYEIGSQCMILKVDGTISKETYTIHSSSSNRKGIVEIASPSMGIIQVQYRRIIPVIDSDTAAVIESGNKLRTVCPNCNYIGSLVGSEDFLQCPSCGPVKLLWLGHKPTVESSKKPKKAKQEQNMDNAIQAAERKIKTGMPIDLIAVSKTKGCELWTKKNIKFDNPKIDVRAHVLLFTDAPARKLCFNTYDGTLGKTSKTLPIEAFLQDKTDADTRKSWYNVADLQKARNQLQRDGYEIQ